MGNHSKIYMVLLTSYLVLVFMTYHYSLMWRIGSSVEITLHFLGGSLIAGNPILKNQVTFASQRLALRIFLPLIVAVIWEITWLAYSDKYISISDIAVSWSGALATLPLWRKFYAHMESVLGSCIKDPDRTIQLN
jgi:hypothetical protein